MLRARLRCSSRLIGVALGLVLSWASALGADITGRVSGSVLDAHAQPVAHAVVTMQSAAQAQSTLTDAQGHYAFVALLPDVYTLTVHHAGYVDASRSGVLVQADLVKDESLTLAPVIAEIGHVTAHSRSSLLQRGVTADVYSLNASQQDASRAFGGGNDRDSITSAIASVPGVFVPVGQQAGWGQSVFLRGGDWSQTGYEYDGVPLNRVFDQYAQSPLSSLGTQEIQVYTGAAPVDQQTEGIGGYVNQVVKSGTYPNSFQGDIGIGGPAFYNKANFEWSGADGPDKKFTYYLGVGGYGFSQRLIDQDNGADLASVYAPIVGYTPLSCAASIGTCYANGATTNYIGSLPIQPNGYKTLPTLWGQSPAGSDEEVVGNVHVAIPHHRDTQNDDLQFLYTNSQYHSTPDASVNGLGADNVLALAPYYVDQNQYNGPLYQSLTNSQLGNISNILFAGHSSATYNDPLQANQSDSQLNEFSLEKLAYRHMMGSDASLRLTLYHDDSSEWQNGIVVLYIPYAAGPYNADYTLASHTNGFDAAYTKQLHEKNLVNVDLSQETSTSHRLNNLVADFYGTSPVAVLVDSTNPLGGCYGVVGTGTQLTNCASGAAASYGLPGVAMPSSTYQLAPTANSPSLSQASSYTCGNGPCEYYTVSNGANAVVSDVTAQFTNFSLGDHLTPSKKLALDLGLRFDLFHYLMGNTDTPANSLFVNTYNQLHCIHGNTIVSKESSSQDCSSFGPGYVATDLSDQSHPLTYTAISPRFGAAYTLDDDNILRFSAGHYVQPAPASAEQAANSAAFYPDPNQYAVYGLNSPTRNVQPETSNNIDLSWEHQFDASTSMKITPFYRTTKNEFADLVIDPKTDFLAYVNGLNRESSGVEFALRHGNFQKNGLSMMFSYTLTHSLAQFAQSPAGGSFVTIANQNLQAFNGFTSFCASNPSNTVCPQTPSVAAAPCYSTTVGASGLGAPAANCGAGSIANPYWNAKPAALLNPNASYPAYSQPLGTGAGGGSTSSTMPNVASLIFNYRRNRFAVTPSFQYEAGARYGSPLAAQGVNPASCTAGLASGVSNDPRYPNGVPTIAANAAPYNAASCSAVMAIPDPYTGTFDRIGEFVQPSLLTMNLQMSYEASKNATIELTATNLLYRCFGGSKVPWGAGNVGCNYAQATPYVGNVYNPGDTIQQLAQFPYTPVINPAVQSNTAGAPLPFELYLDVKFRL